MNTPIDERTMILNALQAFIRQRPGLEPGNYFCGGNYRDNLHNWNAERRSIYVDLQHAEKLLGAVRWCTGITADSLKGAFKNAFSGRLSWEQLWVCPKCKSKRGFDCIVANAGRCQNCINTQSNLPDQHARARAGDPGIMEATGKWRLEYCTGQYFPTEYRKAVCAVLAAALWEYWRDGHNASITTKFKEGSDLRALSVRSMIRKSARKEFGLAIAKRYFDYRPEDYR